MAVSFVIIASLTVAKLDRNGNAIVAIISKIFVSSLIKVRRDFDFVGNNHRGSPSYGLVARYAQEETLVKEKKYNDQIKHCVNGSNRFSGRRFTIIDQLKNI